MKNSSSQLYSKHEKERDGDAKTRQSSAIHQAEAGFTYHTQADIQNRRRSPAQSMKKNTKARETSRIVPSCSNPPREHDRILQFGDHWLEKILDGSKVAEVRGSSTKLGGAWLGRKGVITGWANIFHVQRLATKEDLKSHEHLHQVFDPALVNYKNTYLWHVCDVKPVGPFRYHIQPGPVTWTKFHHPHQQQCNEAQSA